MMDAVTQQYRDRAAEALSQVAPDLRTDPDSYLGGLLTDIAREMARTHVAVERRHALATAFRDWVHESPLSQCGPGADTCPDWDLAYQLADIALTTLADTP